jgi:hypothetical protein
MKTKALVLFSGGLVALLLLVRYLALSRAGIPSGWMLYFGLPIITAGVLFALRLANLGAGWGTNANHVERHNGVPQPFSLPAASVSERLRELEALHGGGAISDTEYSARRLRIIANS